MTRYRWLCWISLAGLGLLGCDTAPDSDLPALVQPAKAEAEMAAAQPAGQDQSARANRNQTSAAAPEPKFAAPFPPRENPFTLPPRGAQGAVSKLPGISETPLRIQLKGFASLDTPRAVLTIDGEVVSLAAGEEHRGVKVLALTPPQVTLQRGRYRWTESLDDAAAAK